MKYLKPYKLFESKKDIKDRISAIDDFLSELSDNGFYFKYDTAQNGTRLIVDISKDNRISDYIPSSISPKFHWVDIKDEVLRLIDLCDDNGLIFRYMGYNSGRNVFADKIKTFETDDDLYLVYLGFDINYDDKEFHLDSESVEDYLYSLRDSGSSPIKENVPNITNVRVETTNLFVSVLGKEHEIMGVCNMYIRGNDEGYKWEDIKNELIKIQDTLNTMTNNSYVLRIGRTKDILSNLLVVNEHVSNTIENVDSELKNGRIVDMGIIIRHN